MAFKLVVSRVLANRSADLDEQPLATDEPQAPPALDSRAQSAMQVLAILVSASLSTYLAAPGPAIVKCAQELGMHMPAESQPSLPSVPTAGNAASAEEGPAPQPEASQSQLQPDPPAEPLPSTSIASSEASEMLAPASEASSATRVTSPVLEEFPSISPGGGGDRGQQPAASTSEPAQLDERQPPVPRCDTYQDDLNVFSSILWCFYLTSHILCSSLDLKLSSVPSILRPEHQHS